MPKISLDSILFLNSSLSFPVFSLCVPQMRFLTFETIASKRNDYFFSKAQKTAKETKTYKKWLITQAGIFCVWLSHETIFLGA